MLVDHEPAASLRNCRGYLPRRRDGADCSSVTVDMATSSPRCPVNGGMVMLEGGGRTVTAARWKHSALAEEYISP